MFIGQLWGMDCSHPPLPLYKDDLLQIFWTRLFPSTARVEVNVVNKYVAIVNNLKFEVLLFDKH